MQPLNPLNKEYITVNNSLDVLRIVEVQMGECSEDDIVRYEDDFGRR